MYVFGLTLYVCMYAHIYIYNNYNPLPLARGGGYWLAPVLVLPFTCHSPCPPLVGHTV